MQIRPIAKEELDSLLQLYIHLHHTDDPLPEPAVVEAIWQEIIRNPCCHYFGSFVEEQLVASCTITIIPNLTRGCRPYGLIENVVTHTDYRRHGLGRTLLAYTQDFAWSQGCYKVMLMTGRKDAATLRFYHSAGFSSDDKQAFIAKAPA